MSYNTVIRATTLFDSLLYWCLCWSRSPPHHQQVLALEGCTFHTYLAVVPTYLIWCHTAFLFTIWHYAVYVREFPSVVALMSN